MLVDIAHDIEVLQTFFAKQAALVTNEYAMLSLAANSEGRSSDEIESDLFHPQGPRSGEELVCRMVVNELNALVEAALQDTFVRVTGDLCFPRNSKEGSPVKILYALNRKELDNELLAASINLQSLEGYGIVLEIKEIAGGNKHRNRLRPIPKWDKLAKTFQPSTSVVPGASEEWISAYELNLAVVSQYLVSATAFIRSVLQANPSAV
mgnify:CR=1 FL=1